MTYPTESIAGAATPTHVLTTFSASAMSGYFANLSDWVELGTSDPLGTSGDFVITVDYGKSTEEKIRCSALDPNTGLITFVERGFDDTTAHVHAAGLPSKPNCFPVLSASDWQGLQDEIAVVGGIAQGAQNDATDALTGASQAIDTAGLAEAHAQTALTNAAAALSAANSKVASVGATNGTIVISGTPTAPTVGVGTVPYSSISGTPTNLPPSGSAGGDLTGSYPNPSVIAGSTTQAGKLQLTNSTSSTSTSTAATPAAVKSAFDLATTANTAASTAQTTANAKVASVTAGDATVTIGGTSTNPTVAVTANTFDPYGAAASKVASVAAADATITIAGTATAPTVKVTANTFDPYGAADTKVASVTAGDATVTIGGTATAPTVKVTANTFDPYGAAASKVASVTAGDSTITIGGTSTAPTVSVSQANLAIAESQVTGLVSDLAGKVPTTRTISTTAPLQGGGDLSANRTLSVDAATTSAAGVVQLTNSIASTSTTTAAVPANVKTAYDLANAALPKSGGTMSGAIAMGTNRITGLAAPAALGDALRAGDFGNTVGSRFHSNAFAIPVLAWTVDPINAGAASGPVSNRTYFQAIYIPYAMTVTGVVFSVSTIGTSITSSSIGLYDSTGTRLVQQSNANAGFGTASTGTVTVAFANSYSITTPGVYWIGFHVQASTSPTLIRAQSANAAAVNININAAAGTLNFRSGYSGTGAIPASFPAGTPTFDVAPWLFGLY